MLLPGVFLSSRVKSMAGALLTTFGADYLLKFQLGKTLIGGLTCHLFVNPKVPALADTPADYVECSLSGYFVAIFTGSAWTGGAVAGVATYMYPTIPFVFDPYVGALVNIYGYYITNPGYTGVIWAEAFVVPVPVPFTGASLRLDLTWIDQGI